MTLKSIEDKEAKIEALRQHFTPLIGKKLSSFETARMKWEGEWGDWFEMPIRLHFGQDFCVSIKWSHFDKLYITSDTTLNIRTDFLEDFRWVSNAVDVLRPALSGGLESVELGRGEFKQDGVWKRDERGREVFSIEHREFEIWTRVLLVQDNGWLEVFNALDVNGFEFHREKPTGDFVTCC